jgi:hypothetical protein
LVAGLEAGEREFGMRGHEVVALIAAKFQKFPCHYRANTMKTTISRARAAAAIAEEAGHGRSRACGKVFSKNVEV